MRRIEKYRRKLEYIIEKITDLPTPNNPYLIDALFYRVHTSIEAAMDVIAMMVKDLGFSVKDDFANVDTLVENGILDNALGEKLRSLNRLRNIIVHRYNKVELEKVLEATEEIKEHLLRFVEVVDNFLEKNFIRNS